MHKEEFLLVYNQWLEETKLLSCSLVDNACFEAIVDAGPSVVPYIVQVLREKPSWIVLALPLILKTAPRMPLGYEGRLEIQVDTWLDHLA